MRINAGARRIGFDFFEEAAQVFVMTMQEKCSHAVPRRNHNLQVAQRLREASALLEVQGADSFRVAAFRHAASRVAELDEDVMDMARREGIEALIRIPNIGKSIASAILEMSLTGRWGRLDRMRGELDPEKLLQCVPGIGPRLAERLHEELHIDTLEGLEAAAHDGRLAALPGIGQRRLAAIQATLDAMLRRIRPAQARPHRMLPTVSELLDVDREYLQGARQGDLPMIAPKRFNPDGDAWLPILHTQRGERHFTALFSNTARAHELGRTHDWVVIYCDDGDHQEEQYTAVTATRGALKGLRIVRGREDQCQEYYQQSDGGDPRLLATHESAA